MPDNTTLNTGSGGDVIATDDIAGVKYQRTKVVWGVDGAATDASASNPLPTVQTGALPAGTNAIGKLAANSGVVIGDVNAVTAPATAADNAVGLPAVTSVVAGYDGTNVQALATNAAGNLQVGLSAAIPAGANTVGKVDQGAGGASAWKVDGSAVTQPVSGTVTPSTSASPGLFLPSLVDVVAGYDGTAVQPLSVDTSGRLAVNVARVAGIAVTAGSGASGTGTQRVILATDQPVVPVSDNGSSLTVDNAGTFAVQIAANQSVNAAQVAGTATDVNSGNKSAGTQRFVIATDQPQLTNAFKVDPSGVTSPVSLAALPTLAAGTNNIGFVTPTPSTTGGWTPKVFTALTNTKTLIKNTAGTLGGYLPIWNPNGAVAYIQVFDVAATASVTLGTTVPDAIISIPPGSAANLEASLGVHFANGIVIAITTTAGGSTAPGTGLDGTLLYK